jgi:hypothetical protein
MRIGQHEHAALITFKDGRKQKIEFPYGSSFLSQSSRFLTVSSIIKKIEISETAGRRRTINF